MDDLFINIKDKSQNSCRFWKFEVQEFNDENLMKIIQLQSTST